MQPSLEVESVAASGSLAVIPGVYLRRHWMINRGLDSGGVPVLPPSDPRKRGAVMIPRRFFYETS